MPRRRRHRRTERPFRATVYLPGHDESGRSPKVRQLSAATEDGLVEAIATWLAQGYRIKAYEVLTLDLDLGEEDDHGVAGPAPEMPPVGQVHAPEQDQRPAPD